MEQVGVWDSLLTELHSAPEERACTPFILLIISTSPSARIPILTPLALQPPQHAILHGRLKMKGKVIGLFSDS